MASRMHASERGLRHSPAVRSSAPRSPAVFSSMHDYTDTSEPPYGAERDLSTQVKQSYSHCPSRVKKSPRSDYCASGQRWCRARSSQCSTGQAYWGGDAASRCLATVHGSSPAGAVSSPPWKVAHPQYCEKVSSIPKYGHYHASWRHCIAKRSALNDLNIKSRRTQHASGLPI